MLRKNALYNIKTTTLLCSMYKELNKYTNTNLILVPSEFLKYFGHPN